MSPEMHALTGAYALDALPDDERHDFEEHLETCDACRREVDELRSTAARLPAAVSQEPPAHLRAAVLEQIDQTRQEPPPVMGDDDQRVPAALGGDDVGRPRGRAESAAARRWGLLLAPAAAVVLILAVGAAVTYAQLTDRIEELEVAAERVEALEAEADRATELQATTDRMADILTAEDVETMTVEGPEGSLVRVVMAVSRGEAVFAGTGMPEAGDDQTYQVWFVHDDLLVDAGLLGPESEPMAIVTGDIEDANAIAVTVEPEGGSEQPTSDPVMLADLGEA